MRPSPGRTLVLALGVGLWLAAAALGVVFLARTAAVEAVLVTWLAAAGVAEPRLSVEEVGLEGLRIAALRLGRGGELRAERVVVAYRPRELLGGRLRRIEITGLRLKAVVGDRGVSVGGLEDLLGGAAAGQRRGPVPPVVLDDARLLAETPLGPVAVLFDGGLQPGPGGAFVVDLAAAIESPFGEAAGTLRVSADEEQGVSGRLAIDRGRLRLPLGGAGDLHGDATFALQGGGLETAALDLALADIAANGVAIGSADLSAAYAGGRVGFEASVRDPDGEARTTLDAEVLDLAAAPKLSVVAKGEVTARSPLWGLAGVPAPSSGGGRFELSARGSLPPGLAPAGGFAAAAVDLLRQAGVEGTVAIEADGVTYPEALAGFTARLSADVGVDAGGVVATLPAGAVFEARSIAPALLSKAGLPAAAVELLTGPLTVVLNGTAEGPLRIGARPRGDRTDVALSGAAAVQLPGGGTASGEATGTLGIDPGGGMRALDLSRVVVALADVGLAGQRITRARAAGRVKGTPRGLEGEADVALALARVEAAGVIAREAVLRASGSFTEAAGKVELSLAEPGVAEVGALALGRRLELAGPLRVTVSAKDGPVASFDLGRPEGATFSHACVFRLAGLEARVLRDDAGPLSVTVSGGVLTLRGGRLPGISYQADADFSANGFAVPELKLTGADVDGSLAVGAAPERPSGRFRIGAVRHTAEPPLVVPLHVAASGQRRGERLAFEAQATGLDDVERLTVSGAHGLETGTGEATVQVPPLAFAPGGLQPGALFPRLADLDAVGGRAGATAQLHWDAAGFSGSGKAWLKKVSFSKSGAAVEGLTIAMDLESLFPPATPPAQALSIERVDLPVPLTDVAVTFRLEADGDGAGRGRLRIERAGTGLVGGRIGFAGMVIEPGAQAHDVTLQADGLEFEQLLRLVKVEGLSGSGRLSGAIPLTVTTESVVVRDGLLTADGPGVIRFRSEQAAKALAGGGESMDLVLRALEDFYYDELALAIDKGAGGEAQIGLRMLGHNPAVLDGHPFRFNINVSGNLDRVVAGLLEAYRASDGLMRRAYEIGR